MRGRLPSRIDCANTGAIRSAHGRLLSCVTSPIRSSCLHRGAQIAGFALAGVLAPWAHAEAANIVTELGSPGTQAWANSCPGAQSAPNGGGEKLTSCNPGAPGCMHRVDIDPSIFPNAVCGDGTPGAFYIRRGQGAEDSKRWVIHLQGGGRAQSYADVEARWCGTQGGLPYDASKMSSDWTGDGNTDLYDHATVPGMTVSSPNNEFEDWNHVFVYYCSSDAWQGTRSNVLFSEGSDSVRIDTRGHTILSVVRRMLRKKGAAAGWVAKGGDTLPDLDGATDIVFSGTSAGARGALNNADWFLTPFPSVEGSLVLDGNMDVSDTVLWNNNIWLDDDNDGVGDINYYSGRIGQELDQWAPGGYLNKIGAFADKSCRAVYAPLGRMDRCSIMSTVLRLNYGGVPLVETPTFVRVDLDDPVLSQGWSQHPNPLGFSLLAGGANGTPTTAASFRGLTRETLVELYDDQDTVTGVIGPRHAKHVGLEDSVAFGCTVVRDTTDATPFGVVSGTAATVHDALWEWLNLGGPRLPGRRLDRPVGGDFTFISCP